jgi:type IV pilus assembly protein PilV
MLRTAIPKTPRGFTLLECVIALAVLMIGLLGYLRFQIVALYADKGARSAVQAQEIARELTAGLLRLDPLDTRLDPTLTGEMPDDFGRVGSAGWRAWSDATAIAGVTLDADLPPDPLDPALPLFQRRWSVWQMENANAASAVRLVAISVDYHEPGFTRTRTVTQYAQVANPGAAAVNASAYR